MQRKGAIELEVDELVIMRECQWLKIREELEINSKLSPFFGKEKITTADILQYFFLFLKKGLRNLR